MINRPIHAHVLRILGLWLGLVIRVSVRARLVVAAHRLVADRIATSKCWTWLLLLEFAQALNTVRD